MLEWINSALGLEEVGAVDRSSPLCKVFQSVPRILAAIVGGYERKEEKVGTVRRERTKKEKEELKTVSSSLTKYQKE